MDATACLFFSVAFFPLGFFPYISPWKFSVVMFSFGYTIACTLEYMFRSLQRCSCTSSSSFMAAACVPSPPMINIIFRPIFSAESMIFLASKPPRAFPRTDPPICNLGKTVCHIHENLHRQGHTASHRESKKKVNVRKPSYKKYHAFCTQIFHCGTEITLLQDMRISSSCVQCTWKGTAGIWRSTMRAHVMDVFD